MTVKVNLSDVSLDFPIYNSTGRSLKNDVLRRVGAGLTTEERNVVVVRALQNINLSLSPGDRVGILGHNGAGKSTLLRVISGAYEPTSGVAEIIGRRSSLLDFQMGMDYELTGVENIVQRAVFLGLTFREARNLVSDVAEFSELGDFLHLPMRTYSTGMTLRLAFAVSTAVQPELLILDEQMGVGDAAFAEKSQKRIRALIENSRILVLASHDVQTIKSFCNLALRMEGGRIVRFGSVDEVM